MYARHSFWRVVIGLMAFGVVIELLQRYISYRSADVFDIVADLVGIAAGLTVGYLGAAGWCQRLEERWTRSRSSIS